MSGRWHASLWALVWLLGGALHAQEGEVQLIVHPMERVEYLLDGKERRKATSQWLRLDTGTHHLVFWAPVRQMWDTTLHIANGDRILLRKNLALTDEYVAHRKQVGRMGRNKFLLKVVPVVGVLVAGNATLKARTRHDEAYAELKQLEASYATLTDRPALAYLKNVNLPQAGQRVDDTRRDMLVLGATTGVAILATVYGFWKASKLVRPVHEDKERLRFEGLSWSPPIHHTPGTIGASFVLR